MNLKEFLGNPYLHAAVVSAITAILVKVIGHYSSKRLSAWSTKEKSDSEYRRAELDAQSRFREQLQKTIDELQAQVANLYYQLESQRQTNAKMFNENLELRAEVSKLKLANIALEAEIVALKKQMNNGN